MVAVIRWWYFEWATLAWPVLEMKRICDGSHIKKLAFDNCPEYRSCGGVLKSINTAHSGLFGIMRSTAAGMVVLVGVIFKNNLFTGGPILNEYGADCNIFQHTIQITNLNF